MENNIYKEQLIEIYSSKKNFGELKGKTHESRSFNPACDDEIIFELKIEKNKVVDAKFRGKMCFVSMISAEVLAEKIKGMMIDDIKKLNKQDIDRLLGVEIIPARAGCELLPLEAIKKLEA